METGFDCTYRAKGLQCPWVCPRWVPFRFNMPSFGRHGCSRHLALGDKPWGQKGQICRVGPVLTGWSTKASWILLEDCRLQRPRRPSPFANNLSNPNAAPASFWHLWCPTIQNLPISRQGCIYSCRICPPSALCILRVDLTDKTNWAMPGEQCSSLHKDCVRLPVHGESAMHMSSREWTPPATFMHWYQTRCPSTVYNTLLCLCGPAYNMPIISSQGPFNSRAWCFTLTNHF